MTTSLDSAPLEDLPPAVSLKYTPAAPKRDTSLLDAFRDGNLTKQADKASAEYVHRNHDFTVDGITLSAEQQAAVLRLMNCTNRTRVLTGRAGAGKSLVLKYLRKRYGLKVCAATGKAAVNVGGTTVHNLFAYDANRRCCFAQGYLDFNMSKSTRDIGFDEASMCGEGMAVYLMDKLEKYDKRLILIGDWAQASPVKDTWPFNTSFWRDAEFVKLQECHRQTDRDFIDALDQARMGQIGPQAADIFRSRVNPFPEDVPGLVRMYATNEMTRDFNMRRLKEHVNATGNQPFQLDANFFDNRDPQKQKDSPRNGEFQDNAIDDSRMAHRSLFAIGVQVIITKNAKGVYDSCTDEVHKEYVNGDTGIVEDILNVAGESLDRSKSWLSDDVCYVVIRRTRDDTLITLGRDRAESKDAMDRVTHYVLGFPLALGWAMSIHKSQGMTVDNAWLDMGSISAFPKTGRHGLGYVGLSRTRTLAGLGLSSFIPEVVVCDEEVRPWI